MIMRLFYQQFSLLRTETDNSHDREIEQYSAVNQTICSVPLHTLIDESVLLNFPVMTVVSLNKYKGVSREWIGWLPPFGVEK